MPSLIEGWTKRPGTTEQFFIERFLLHKVKVFRATVRLVRRGVRIAYMASIFGLASGAFAQAELPPPVTDSESPLIEAVRRGDARAIETLLEQGVEIDEPAGTIVLWVRNGAANQMSGATALLVAINRSKTDIARLLLDRGADPSPVAKGPFLEGTTPLIIAAMRDDLGMVENLLSRGADPSRPDARAMTALGWAVENGNAEISKALLQAGSPVDTGYAMNAASPIAVASALGHTEIIELLIQSGADLSKGNMQGQSPLQLALHWEHTDAALALLRGGAKPDERDSTGATALIYAARLPDGILLEAMLAAGADPNSQTNNGNTPLIEAAAEGNASALGILISAGATVDAKGARGNTALQWASAKDHVDVAKLLLEAGADPSVIDEEGKTARDFARSDEMKKLLNLPE